MVNGIKMVCTMALRSRMNHRNSLRYSGSLPKRVPVLFAETGPASAAAKFPVRPCCVPQTLNRTLAATAIPDTSQQVARPERNEKDPVEYPPTNTRNHGQGNHVKRYRKLPRALTILGRTKRLMKTSIMDA